MHEPVSSLRLRIGGRADVRTRNRHRTRPVAEGRRTTRRLTDAGLGADAGRPEDLGRGQTRGGRPVIEEHRPTDRGHKQRLELSRRQDDGDVERRRNVVIAVVSGDSRTERIDVQAGQQQRDSRAGDEQPGDDPHIRTVAQALFGRRGPWGQMRELVIATVMSPRRSSWHRSHIRAQPQQRLPGAHQPAARAADRRDGPRDRRHHRRLHLHRLEDDQRSPAVTCAPGATAISQTLPVIVARTGDGVGGQRLAPRPGAVGRGIRLLGRRRQRGPARALRGEGRPLLEAKRLDRRWRSRRESAGTRRTGRSVSSILRPTLPRGKSSRNSSSSRSPTGVKRIWSKKRSSHGLPSRNVARSRGSGSTSGTVRPTNW